MDSINLIKLTAFFKLYIKVECYLIDPLDFENDCAFSSNGSDLHILSPIQPLFHLIGAIKHLYPSLVRLFKYESILQPKGG
jgi:hypothetical protein